MPTSLDIARAAALRPIADVGAELGLSADELEPWGAAVAKVSGAALRRVAPSRRGRLLVVTAVTPTGRGEGKTTLTVGLVYTFGGSF